MRSAHCAAVFLKSARDLDRDRLLVLGARRPTVTGPADLWRSSLELSSECGRPLSFQRGLVAAVARQHEDGWGRWFGGYSYEIAWGDTSTIGGADGSFTVSRDRDYQFHAWAYVYVKIAKTIPSPAAEIACPGSS